jgi:hypothetical protein
LCRLNAAHNLAALAAAFDTAGSDLVAGRGWNGSFDRLDEYVQDLKQATREEPTDGDDQ